VRGVQWLTIDTRNTPELEDERHSRVITGPGENYRSGGSYVYAIFEGFPQTLQFKFDPSAGFETSKRRLVTELNESFMRPIKKLLKCDQIKYLDEKREEIDYMVVWFQAKLETEVNKRNDPHSWHIYANLVELSLRDFFTHGKEERVSYFRIYDKQCAQLYGVDPNADAIVFIPGSANLDKNGDNLPLLSNDKDFSLEGLASWINTAINDIEQEFTKRVLYTIMDE
jgi:hypothetical protein